MTDYEISDIQIEIICSMIKKLCILADKANFDRTEFVKGTFENVTAMIIANNMDFTFYNVGDANGNTMEQVGH